jgi:hypothetical protein
VACAVVAVGALAGCSKGDAPVVTVTYPDQPTVVGGYGHPMMSARRANVPTDVYNVYLFRDCPNVTCDNATDDYGMVDEAHVAKVCPTGMMMNVLLMKPESKPQGSFNFTVPGSNKTSAAVAGKIDVKSVTADSIELTLSPAAGNAAWAQNHADGTFKAPMCKARK